MKSFILFCVNILVKLHVLTPIRVARLKFWYKLHRWPDFEHPKDINEKINWLKFYGDTSQWPMLADKYRVREYVKACGFEECLIPLIGKWDSVDEIEWDKLPQQFVMKCNNGSGDVKICKDKESLDKNETLGYFQKKLNKQYGVLSGETHYALIPPCIIAEELLEPSQQANGSPSLVDYKIFCFNGQPAYIACCSNRHDTYFGAIGVYDTDWNWHPEYVADAPHYKSEDSPLRRPPCLSRMLDIASHLSKGVPHVRVDLYEVKGQVYFGEMTLTPNGGYMDLFTQEFLDKLGALTQLS